MKILLVNQPEVYYELLGTEISYQLIKKRIAEKIPDDVTEDVIRNYALQNELVDVKVCAVSDVWSACLPVGRD